MNLPLSVPDPECAFSRAAAFQTVLMRDSMAMRRKPRVTSAGVQLPHRQLSFCEGAITASLIPLGVTLSHPWHLQPVTSHRWAQKWPSSHVLLKESPGAPPVSIHWGGKWFVNNSSVSAEVLDFRGIPNFRMEEMSTSYFHSALHFGTVSGNTVSVIQNQVGNREKNIPIPSSKALFLSLL